MNIGLLGGLAAGFNSLGAEIGKKHDEDRQDARDLKKMQLARDLQLQVLQAKQEYAKANPEYKHFVPTPSGDIVGFSEHGDHFTMEGSDATKAVIKQKLDNDAAYKAAQAASLAANASLVAPRAAVMGSIVDKNKALTDKAERDPTPKINTTMPAGWLLPDQFSKKQNDLLSIGAGLGKGENFQTTLNYAKSSADKAQAAQSAGQPLTPRQQSAIQEYQRLQNVQADVAKQMQAYHPTNADEVSKLKGLVAPADTSQSDDSDADTPTDLGDFSTLIPSN